VYESDDKTSLKPPSGPITDPPFVLKRYVRPAPGVLEELGLEDEAETVYNAAMAEGQPWYKRPVAILAIGVLVYGVWVTNHRKRKYIRIGSSSLA
jgi:hypothetical protein